MNKGLFSFIIRNFRLKILAVIVAASAWIIIMLQSNPPEVKTYFVPVPQGAKSIASPFILSSSIPPVQVTVTGMQDTFDTFNLSDLSATANYSVIHSVGIQSIPLSIHNEDPNVALNDPPTAISVTVDTVGSVTMPVNLITVDPPPVGYVVGGQTISPQTVMVSGPSRQLATLKAEVQVNLSKEETNVQGTYPVVVVDKAGNIVNNIQVSPADIQVAVIIQTVTVSRVSAVVPKTAGSVVSGYEVTSISVSPDLITLTGAHSVLNALDTISTQPINLAGITADYSETVTLVLPAGVTANPSFVTVTIGVAPVVLPSPSISPTPTPSSTATPTPTA